MGSEPGTVGIIILLLVVTFIKGICCSFKESVLFLNKNNLKKSDNKREMLLLKVLNNPNKILASIELVKAIVTFAMGAVIGLSRVKNYKIGSNPYFIILIILVLIIIQVFGDAIPKIIASKNSERVAIRTVRVVYFIYNIFLPITTLINFLACGMQRLFGFDKKDYLDKMTKEDIQSIVETGEEHGVINESEKEMIESIFRFSDKKVEKVMKARTEVFCIDIKEPLCKYLDEMLENRYSRIPVYEENIDNIIGILYIKDFFIAAKNKGFDNVNIRELLKEAYFIPEVNSVKEVFEELQKSKKQIAIIIDEYGGFSGIVTIEDLIEEIMGEIDDEFEAHENGIHEINSNTYLVDGVTLLEDINDRLDIEINSEEMDTLSGYLINLIGRIPMQNERIVEYENLTFIIEEVSDKRIEKVVISIKDK